jgi:hypothetical protein
MYMPFKSDPIPSTWRGELDPRDYVDPGWDPAEHQQVVRVVAGESANLARKERAPSRQESSTQGAA